MLERDSARPSQAERCILIGAITREQSEAKSTEYLEELRFLAYTAGAETLEVFTQKLDRPDSGTFLGSGKMEEIKEYIHDNGVDLAIF
ncbi:MAG: GTPase HflX, partial [Flavobacteriia bacterium]|nr:GTPase HflX [Flavobacteriia bacterium]